MSVQRPVCDILNDDEVSLFLVYCITAFRSSKVVPIGAIQPMTAKKISQVVPFGLSVTRMNHASAVTTHSEVDVSRPNSFLTVDTLLALLDDRHKHTSWSGDILLHW